MIMIIISSDKRQQRNKTFTNTLILEVIARYNKRSAKILLEQLLSNRTGVRAWFLSDASSLHLPLRVYPFLLLFQHVT